jgi:glyoxylase-like metal-dependent hydrolase (beta-lactamase superfamily II)
MAGPAVASTAERIHFPCEAGPAAGQAAPLGARAPDIRWLRLPLPSRTATVNAWAVRDGAGFAVFDTGMDTEPARLAWQNFTAAAGPLGGPPTRVFATHHHADHVGLAGWLVQAHGCELWMTRSEYLQARLFGFEKDLPPAPELLQLYRSAGWPEAWLTGVRSMGRNVAPLPARHRRLHDGQRLRIGDHDWQVVVGSGHSPEHACFHCPALGLLIAGDQVLPDTSSNVSVWAIEPQADPLADWLDSIERLRARIGDDVLVLPAHGEAFSGLHARLDSLARKRHRALAALAGRLAQGPCRALDCFSVLFGRADFDEPFVRQLATGEALAYLNHLIARGRAWRSEAADGTAWYHAQRAAAPPQPSFAFEDRP